MSSSSYREEKDKTRDQESSATSRLLSINRKSFVDTPDIDVRALIAAKAHKAETRPEAEMSHAEEASAETKVTDADGDCGGGHHEGFLDNALSRAAQAVDAVDDAVDDAKAGLKELKEATISGAADHADEFFASVLTSATLATGKVELAAVAAKAGHRIGEWAGDRIEAIFGEEQDGIKERDTAAHHQQQQQAAVEVEHQNEVYRRVRAQAEMDAVPRRLEQDRQGMQRADADSMAIDRGAWRAIVTDLQHSLRQAEQEKSVLAEILGRQEEQQMSGFLRHEEELAAKFRAMQVEQDERHEMQLCVTSDHWKQQVQELASAHALTTEHLDYSREQLIAVGDQFAKDKQQLQEQSSEERARWSAELVTAKAELATVKTERDALILQNTEQREALKEVERAAKALRKANKEDSKNTKAQLVQMEEDKVMLFNELSKVQNKLKVVRYQLSVATSKDKKSLSRSDSLIDDENVALPPAFTERVDQSVSKKGRKIKNRGEPVNSSKPLPEWSVEDVVRFFQLFKCNEEILQKVHSNNVDGTVMDLLTTGRFTRLTGISFPHHVHAILSSWAKLREERVSPVVLAEGAAAEETLIQELNRRVQERDEELEMQVQAYEEAQAAYEETQDDAEEMVVNAVQLLDMMEGLHKSLRLNHQELQSVSQDLQDAISEIHEKDDYIQDLELELTRLMHQDAMRETQTHLSALQGEERAGDKPSGSGAAAQENVPVSASASATISASVAGTPTRDGAAGRRRAATLREQQHMAHARELFDAEQLLVIDAALSDGATHTGYKKLKEEHATYSSAMAGMAEEEILQLKFSILAHDAKHQKTLKEVQRLQAQHDKMMQEKLTTLDSSLQEQMSSVASALTAAHTETLREVRDQHEEDLAAHKASVVEAEQHLREMKHHHAEATALAEHHEKSAKQLKEEAQQQQDLIDELKELSRTYETDRGAERSRADSAEAKLAAAETELQLLQKNSQKLQREVDKALEQAQKQAHEQVQEKKETREVGVLTEAESRAVSEMQQQEVAELKAQVSAASIQQKEWARSLVAAETERDIAMFAVASKGKLEKKVEELEKENYDLRTELSTLHTSLDSMRIGSNQYNERTTSDSADGDTDSNVEEEQERDMEGDEQQSVEVLNSPRLNRRNSWHADSQAGSLVLGGGEDASVQQHATDRRPKSAAAWLSTGETEDHGFDPEDDLYDGEDEDGRGRGEEDTATDFAKKFNVPYTSGSNQIHLEQMGYEHDNMVVFDSEVYGAVIGIPDTSMDGYGGTQGDQDTGSARGAAEATYAAALEEQLLRCRANLAETAAKLEQMTSQRDSLLGRCKEYRDILRSLSFSRAGEQEQEQEQEQESPQSQGSYPVRSGSRSRGRSKSPNSFLEKQRPASEQSRRVRHTSPFVARKVDVPALHLQKDNDVAHGRRGKARTGSASASARPGRQTPKAAQERRPASSPRRHQEGVPHIQHAYGQPSHIYRDPAEQVPQEHDNHLLQHHRNAPASEWAQPPAEPPPRLVFRPLPANIESNAPMNPTHAPMSWVDLRPHTEGARPHTRRSPSPPNLYTKTPPIGKTKPIPVLVTSAPVSPQQRQRNAVKFVEDSTAVSPIQHHRTSPSYEPDKVSDSADPADRPGSSLHTMESFPDSSPHGHYADTAHDMNDAIHSSVVPTKPTSSNNSGNVSGSRSGGGSGGGNKPGRKLTVRESLRQTEKRHSPVDPASAATEQLPHHQPSHDASSSYADAWGYPADAFASRGAKPVEELIEKSYPQRVQRVTKSTPTRDKDTLVLDVYAHKAAPPASASKGMPPLLFSAGPYGGGGDSPSRMSSSLDRHAALNDYHQLTVGFAESIGAYSAEGPSPAYGYGPAPQREKADHRHQPPHSAARYAQPHPATDVLAIFDHEEDLDHMLLRLQPSGQPAHAATLAEKHPYVSDKKRATPAEEPIPLTQAQARHGGAYYEDVPSYAHMQKNLAGLSPFAVPMSARSAPAPAPAHAAPAQDVNWHVPAYNPPVTSRSDGPAPSTQRPGGHSGSENARAAERGRGEDEDEDELLSGGDSEQYKDEWDEEGENTGDGTQVQEVPWQHRQQQQARGGVVPLLHTTDQQSTQGVPSIIMPSTRFTARSSRPQSANSTTGIGSGSHSGKEKDITKMYVNLQPHTRGDHVRQNPAYNPRPSPGALREVKEWGTNLHINAIPRKQVHTKLW